MKQINKYIQERLHINKDIKPIFNEILDEYEECKFKDINIYKTNRINNKPIEDKTLINEISKYFDDEEISEEEYDTKLNELKQEYIKDELTLDGCSCFELNDEGIEFSNRYGYDDRQIITIFEGEEVEAGHDGEVVAKCEKIIWQGNSKELVDIFYDDDIENKIEEVLIK